ncbi:MAG: neutral/alkaline non-lysosomal ceramidase N-terminal domain-containing protein [Acidimicrobiia bacterium]|nr:neutral/alkaline non-lysosomal ceramidase N-terminal domain-containing protein [Acidimicrobiia bacterium]
MEGCRIGVGRARITPDATGGTLGWGSLGRKDARPPDEPDQQLFVTALTLEDAGGERVVFLNADLHCGGAHLWRAAIEAAELDSSRVVLCGTHTHAGPGQRYGGLMYSLFAAASPRTSRASTRRLAPLVARAVSESIAALAPGGVDVVRRVVTGTGSNRAVPAWSHYTDEQRASFETDGPGHGLGDEQHAADRLRDPRVTALVAATDDGGQQCVLAWFAVHGTSLGADWPEFGADLWGVARHRAETALDGTLVGFGGGSSGDISPLPLDEAGEKRGSSGGRPGTSGRELASVVGSRLGEAILELVPTASLSGFALGVAHEMWEPTRSGLPGPLTGLATAGGGVDGETGLWEAVKAGIHAPRYQAHLRRRSSMKRGQGPKMSMLVAYTSIPLPIGWLFRLLAPRRLPIHVVRVGNHTFATVPGEPTTFTGWRIEDSVRRAAGTTSASIIGFAGDYGGYWVTPEEYLEQRYEAASTIFGKNASTVLERHLTQLAGRVGDPAADQPSSSET